MANDQGQGGALAALMLLGSAHPVWASFVLIPLPHAPEALDPSIGAATKTALQNNHHRARVANVDGQIMPFSLAVRHNAGGLPSSSD